MFTSGRGKRTAVRDARAPGIIVMTDAGQLG
jgi:hypothetical protein